jgi:hypothetical protein
MNILHLAVLVIILKVRCHLTTLLLVQGKANVGSPATDKLQPHQRNSNSNSDSDYHLIDELAKVRICELRAAPSPH